MYVVIDFVVRPFVTVIVAVLFSFFIGPPGSSVFAVVVLFVDSFVIVIDVVLFSFPNRPPRPTAIVDDVVPLGAFGGERIETN